MAATGSRLFAAAVNVASTTGVVHGSVTRALSAGGVVARLASSATAGAASAATRPAARACAAIGSSPAAASGRAFAGAANPLMSGVHARWSSSGTGGETSDTPTVPPTAEPPSAATPAEGAAAAPSLPANPTAQEVVELKPRELVTLLDRHIIGQTDAKRAVAIALRNRWRRLQLQGGLKTEVIPRNILMVGPTGCGKTEIARRLAKLVKAPFVKVEATKFTEVGFHGRDVDMIIRDLVEVSINITRKAKMEEFKADIGKAVEDRILAILTGPEARADTVDSFRRLLREGHLEERRIEVDVPINERGGGPSGVAIPIDLGGGMNGINDVMGKIVGRIGGKRSETQRLTIAEARPILEEVEMEKKLAGIDIVKEAIHNAEENGIVFIDEIDKITSASDNYRGPEASAEGVQRDLLPLVEGCIIHTRHGNVSTDHMLFIASGAFHSTKPSDMLPELQGRFPIRVQLSALTEADMCRILTEPEANLIRQQTSLIATEGVTLVFTEAAIKEIARVAAEMNRTIENIGARRLHTVVERLVEEVSFNASDMAPGSTITLDKADVQMRLGDMLKQSDLSKFIL